MDLFRKLGREAEKAKRAATSAASGESDAGDGLEVAYRCRDCAEAYAAPREECLECGGTRVEPVEDEA